MKVVKITLEYVIAMKTPFWLTNDVFTAFQKIISKEKKDYKSLNFTPPKFAHSNAVKINFQI